MPDPGNEKLINKTGLREFANLIMDKQQLRSAKNVAENFVAEWCH